MYINYGDRKLLRVQFTDEQLNQIIDDEEKYFKRHEKFARWLENHFQLKDWNGKKLDHFGYLLKAAEIKHAAGALGAGLAIGCAGDWADKRLARLPDSTDARIGLAYCTGAGASLTGALIGLSAYDAERRMRLYSSAYKDLYNNWETTKPESTEAEDKTDG